MSKAERGDCGRLIDLEEAFGASGSIAESADDGKILVAGINGRTVSAG